MNSKHSCGSISTKFNQTIFFLFTLLVLLSSCKKEENSQPLKNYFVYRRWKEL